MKVTSNMNEIEVSKKSMEALSVPMYERLDSRDLKLIESFLFNSVKNLTEMMACKPIRSKVRSKFENS